jgi:MFS family permease
VLTAFADSSNIIQSPSTAHENGSTRLRTFSFQYPGVGCAHLFKADVRDGVGPYLSIYLKGALHWQSGEIGIAMAVSSITAAICQIPAGLLVDAVRAKRLLVVISGIMVGIGSLLVVCLPKLAVIARTHHLAGFRRVISSWQCGDVADGWTGTCEEASWR